ncbi:MAG TPA: hypothetical protein VHA56_14505 [Mucilaginibacter sp.]|nr:hypothetical protein [Mucilaginibacter sp.]
MEKEVKKIYLKDDGVFPNSQLPVLFYEDVLNIPALFPATHVKNLFSDNGWSNSWDDGIFTYHHYHSITHEVLGIYKGETTLKLGGESDAGVVGAYPGGMNYDMNYGKPGERPGTDENIKEVPIPETDPVDGLKGSLQKLWQC